MTLNEPTPTSMTTAELVKKLREPGKVFVPVLVPGDVMHIEAVKADVIHMLGGYLTDGPAPFVHVGMTEEGNHWLDVNR